MIDFSQQIAVITGSGKGLGRSHAIELAKHGCYVVINDISEEAAKETATHINNTFKKDLAIIDTNNITSEEGIQRLIQNALKSFPQSAKLTILINNAGILRDKTLNNMSVQDWNDIYDIHLKSCFLLTKNVWPIMKNQNYGKILFTTSAAGLYGNFGQSNYAACKQGLIGFCKSISLEGQKFNINVNCISPFANTQILSQSKIDNEILQLLKVEQVSPLAVYLCSKNCSETGQVYEVAGNLITKVRVERGKPFIFSSDKENTVENIEKNWNEINQFYQGEGNEEFKYPSNAGVALQSILQFVNENSKSATTTSQPTVSKVDKKVEETANKKEENTSSIIMATRPEQVTKEGFKCSELFSKMIFLIQQKQELIPKFRVIYVFDLKNDNSNERQQWTLNLKSKEEAGIMMGVQPGVKVDCYMTMTDSACHRLMTGQTTPQAAYLKGQVKVKGSINLALKLTSLQKLLSQTSNL